MTVRPESSSSTRTSSGCSTSHETMYSSVSRDPMAWSCLWLAGTAGVSPGWRIRRRCGLLPGNDAGNLHQPGHRLRGLGALADPFQCSGAVDLDEGGLPHGVVAADVLDEPPVPRRPGVGDDHAVAGLALFSDATKSDLDHAGECTRQPEPGRVAQPTWEENAPMSAVAKPQP